MRVRQLTVRNYRGIKKADWSLDSRFIALVGPGDSTKTTLLDALGLVLSSRYTETFTDADFYNSDTSTPIVIEAVVVDLPKPLVEERAHGKNRSGIRDDGTLEHDPITEEGVAACLIIRLTIDSSLEPEWSVVRPGEAEGERISSSQREQLGFFRIGDYANTHLRWSRGSALSAMTKSTGTSSAVVEAQRGARDAVAGLTETPLHDAATKAQQGVKKLGSGPFKNLKPGLDPHLMASNAALVLYDESVPLSQFGLGSRRLLSLAIQENALAGNSIVAIDEVESGLDPHRLFHLIRYLQHRAADEELQIVLTTHSALVVEALEYHEIFVVRSSNDGTTTIKDVPRILEQPKIDVIQGVMRERPSAFLAQKVLVGEGATEVGFARQILEDFDIAKIDLSDLTSVTVGAGIANGSGGSQAPQRAQALAELGYPTLLLIDGDVTDNSDEIREAQEAGVEIIQWPEGEALEDVIFRTLDLEAVQKLIDFAIDEKTEESICATVSAHIGVQVTGPKVADWLKVVEDEASLRRAIGLAAKGAKINGQKQDSKAWFKREDRGEQLGAVVMRNRTKLEGPLAEALNSIETFIYGG